MSIIPLERVTFAGLSSSKAGLLDHLHAKGCLELIPLGNQGHETDGGPTAEARQALQFLLSCRHARRQTRDDSRFDALAVEQQSLALRKQVQDLQAERDTLLQQIIDVKPWGDFTIPPIEQTGGLQMWFYVVANKDLEQVSALCPAFEIVRRDPQQSYVVVMSENEPVGMPAPRVRIGARSLTELEHRLEEVEQAIDDAETERVGLARWGQLLARHFARVEDAAVKEVAMRQTCDRDPLFALQAWSPQDRVGELAEFAARNQLHFENCPPSADDQPPTLLSNSSRLSAGEDLVNFYMTPGYFTWDPSRIVFISFALFFAMILADAGYAALLGLCLMFGWKVLGRSSGGRRIRPLLALICIFSLVYGVLVGSYFGVAPGKQSPLGRLHALDMNNSPLMMGLAVLVGGLHVILANLMDARRYADWRDGLASIGWACAVAGGLMFGAAAAIPAAGLVKPIGLIALVVGLLLVVGFTAWREKPGTRLLHGLLGLTRISSAFGDILSYLRLFALGLASASLALAFNDMATNISKSLPGLGLALAIVVLLFGHALNLLLGVSSGVIHGLRLNVIEFFNWGLKDEGRLFAPFQRKEDSQWNSR